MNVKIGSTITLRFTTTNALSGAAATADSLPTVAVYEDASDTPIVTPAAVLVATGQYRVDVAVTAGNGFEAGKSYSVVATAVVASVTGKGVIAQFIAQVNDLDSLPSAVAIRTEIDDNSVDLNMLLIDMATLLARITTLRAANLDNLDAAVGTRLAASAYVAPDNARLLIVEKILRNKTITDPVAGTITVYDDDGTTVYLTAPLYEDAAAATPYKGAGAERRERLV